MIIEVRLVTNYRNRMTEMTRIWSNCLWLEGFSIVVHLHSLGTHTRLLEESVNSRMCSTDEKFHVANEWWTIVARRHEWCSDMVMDNTIGDSALKDVYEFGPLLSLWLDLGVVEMTDVGHDLSSLLLVCKGRGRRRRWFGSWCLKLCHTHKDNML